MLITETSVTNTSQTQILRSLDWEATWVLSVTEMWGSMPKGRSRPKLRTFDPETAFIGLSVGGALSVDVSVHLQMAKNSLTLSLERTLFLSQLALALSVTLYYTILYNSSLSSLRFS